MYLLVDDGLMFDRTEMASQDGGQVSWRAAERQSSEELVIGAKGPRGPPHLGGSWAVSEWCKMHV